MPRGATSLTAKQPKDRFLYAFSRPWGTAPNRISEVHRITSSFRTSLSWSHHAAALADHLLARVRPHVPVNIEPDPILALAGALQEARCHGTWEGLAPHVGEVV